MDIIEVWPPSNQQRRQFPREEEGEMGCRWRNCDRAAFYDWPGRGLGSSAPRSEFNPAVKLLANRERFRFCVCSEVLYLFVKTLSELPCLDLNPQLLLVSSVMGGQRRSTRLSVSGALGVSAPCRESFCVFTGHGFRLLAEIAAGPGGISGGKRNP